MRSEVSYCMSLTAVMQHKLRLWFDNPVSSLITLTSPRPNGFYICNSWQLRSMMAALFTYVYDKWGVNIFCLFTNDLKSTGPVLLTFLRFDKGELISKKKVNFYPFQCVYNSTFNAVRWDIFTTDKTEQSLLMGPLK